jgi:hypothetical protein
MPKVSDCFGGFVGLPCWRCKESASFMRDNQAWCWDCLELVDPAAFDVAKQAQVSATAALCSNRKIEREM